MVKLSDELVSLIADVASTLPNDLRMEVVAAYLISTGIDPDEILFSPIGLFQRNYSRDLERISSFEVKSGKEYLLLDVNREGIYDAIPEAIRHTGPVKKNSGLKTAREMIAEIKVRKQEESAARLFFRPFENEFCHQLVHLEMEEQSIVKGYMNDSGYAQMLHSFWQLPDFLNSRQKAIFIYLIPVTHKIAGNYNLTKLCYEAILGQKVDLQVKRGGIIQVPKALLLDDDQCRLGLTFVCGGLYESQGQFLEITIEPTDQRALTDFLPSGKGHRVLDFLNACYLPFDFDRKVKVKTDSQNGQFYVGTTTTGPRLGYSTYL